MGESTNDVIKDLGDGPLSDGRLAELEAAIKAGEGAAEAAEIVGLLRQHAVTQHVAETVASEISLDVLLPRLIEIVTDTLKADRATLFLFDDQTEELYSRISRGDQMEEIRIPDDAGLAGAAFKTGEALNIPDAYADPRFNASVDRQTGYRTRNMLCAPLRNRSGTVIGVTQVLNKLDGQFEPADAAMLSTITAQAAAELEHAQMFERLEKARHEEARFMELMSAISSELHLELLIEKIIKGTTELLEAERGTLFLYDEKAGELWSLVAEGAGTKEIRIPSDAGIAGWVCTNREVLNIPDAYADSRFNPDVDRATGFRTRSILCMPVMNKQGQVTGVTQVLNKAGGAFKVEDERRLRAISAQVVAALENAQLFDEVVRLNKYNEGILKSLTNGVVTMDLDGVIERVNAAASRILATSEADIQGRPADAVFGDKNAWIVNSLRHVVEHGDLDFHADTDLYRSTGDSLSVNLAVAPLQSVDDTPAGYMMVMEDITREKRVRSTMARYMASEVVDRLLESGEVLGKIILTV